MFGNIDNLLRIFMESKSTRPIDNHQNRVYPKNKIQIAIGGILGMLLIQIKHLQRYPHGQQIGQNKKMSKNYQQDQRNEKRKTNLIDFHNVNFKK